MALVLLAASGTGVSWFVLVCPCPSQASRRGQGKGKKTRMSPVPLVCSPRLFTLDIYDALYSCGEPAACRAPGLCALSALVLMRRL